MSEASRARLMKALDACLERVVDAAARAADKDGCVDSENEREQSRQSSTQLLLGLGVAGIAVVLLQQNCQKPSSCGVPEWPSSVEWARAGWILFFIPIAQFVVRIQRKALDKWFEVEPAPGNKNRRPQEVLGVVENVLFPILIFNLASQLEALANALSGWVLLKVAGNWLEWRSDANDPHETRRRLFVFLLCNVTQVLFGVCVAMLMNKVRLE